MSSIKENLQSFKNSLPENVKLIAVSKTKPIELLQEAIDAGHLDLGENKVQELVQKEQQNGTRSVQKTLGDNIPVRQDAKNKSRGFSGL